MDNYLYYSLRTKRKEEIYLTVVYLFIRREKSYSRPSNCLSFKNIIFRYQVLLQEVQRFLPQENKEHKANIKNGDITSIKCFIEKNKSYKILYTQNITSFSNSNFSKLI